MTSAHTQLQSKVPKCWCYKRKAFKVEKVGLEGFQIEVGHVCLIILIFELFLHNNFTTDYFTILNMMGRSWLWKGSQGVQMGMTKTWEWGGGVCMYISISSDYSIPDLYEKLWLYLSSSQLFFLWRYKLPSSPVLVTFYTKPLILMEQKETAKSNPLIVLCVG